MAYFLLKPEKQLTKPLEAAAWEDAVTPGVSIYPAFVMHIAEVAMMDAAQKVCERGLREGFDRDSKMLVTQEQFRNLLLYLTVGETAPWQKAVSEARRQERTTSIHPFGAGVLAGDYELRRLALQRDLAKSLGRAVKNSGPVQEI